MKKHSSVKFLILPLLSVSVIGASISGYQFKSAFAVDNDAPFVIKDENNLATWKYDWDVCSIGGARTSFDSGNLRMENINQASSNYAMYTTNRFNEWRLDMRANLGLAPTKSGVDETGKYCNLYLTYFIDFEDIGGVEHPSQAACPWNMNKGWLSVCFERNLGKNYVQLLINETFDGNGANRFYQVSDNPKEGTVESTVNFADGQEHYFTIEVTSKKRVNPAKPRPKEEGTTVSVYIDGIKQTSYFQSNWYASNTTKKEEAIEFSTKKGYLGFWASSNYGGTQDTSNTGIGINIPALQITSYDGLEDKALAKPYKQCPKPNYRVESLIFSPAASYDVNQEIEINMKKLFEYKGDGQIEYTAYNADGDEIGEMMNGFFVWTPDKVDPEYIVTFEATAPNGSYDTNEVEFNVVEVKEDEPVKKNNNLGLILGLSIGGGVILLAVIVIVIIILKKKKHKTASAA